MSEILKRSLAAERMPRAGSPAPGISTERLAAISAGATRLITGYYRASGETLQVTAFAEDPATQKIGNPVRASGSLASVSSALAKSFGAPNAPDFNTASRALREYSIGSDSSGAAAARHFELALQSDPNFGPAYVGLVQAAVASNDLPLARQGISAASAHSSSLGKQDQAYLRLEAATLTRDSRARAEALADVNALGKADGESLRVLADSEMNARKPAEAAQHYRQAIALAPQDGNLRNLLTYALIYSGDENAARSAAAEYKRLRPADPNAFDTQGDVELAFGHFADAEKIYLSNPDPTFQNSLPTWKAARSRLMSGDTAGANVVFERHRTALETAGNPGAQYRKAEWLELTGHRKEAAASMASFAATARQPEVRSAAFAQAGVWALLMNDRAHAAEWSGAALNPPQASTFLTAAITRFSAQPPVSPEEWQRRAEKNVNGPDPTSIRRFALGYALLLNRDFEQAVPVWKAIYDTTGVNETAPVFLYAWTLLETGHKKEASALLRLNPVPNAGVAPSYESLYFPAYLEWRKLSLRQ